MSTMSNVGVSIIGRGDGGQVGGAVVCAMQQLWMMEFGNIKMAGGWQKNQRRHATVEWHLDYLNDKIFDFWESLIYLSLSVKVSRRLTQVNIQPYCQSAVVIHHF